MAAQPSQHDNAITALLRVERFRRIVNWLCKHSEELAELDKVQIVFDCAGKKVSASKKETFHDI
jgi:hypothetical protein